MWSVYDLEVTLKNEDLLFCSILSESNQLLFETQRDINLDKKFNSEDELIWYSLDLAIGGEPKEIIDSLLRNKIKTQFFNQWIMKK